jgi:hypothetical protein
MVKSIKDLDIQLMGAETSILRPENGFFLQGERSEVALDSLWEGWKIIGKAAIAIGIPAVLAVTGFLGYSIVWNSPLAVEIEGTVDSYQSSGVKVGYTVVGDVRYHYTVNDVRYDKIEASSTYVSAWDQGNVPYPVVYLRFQPSVSRLEHNVEPIEWMFTIFLLLFAISIPIWGRYVIRHSHKMISLRDEATHVLPGEVVGNIRMKYWQNICTYRATSPITGRNISGKFVMGRFHPRIDQFKPGATVALIYKDDKCHTVL